MAAALILFALPSGEPDGERLLQWENAKTIRWDVLILFGGGLSLASAIDSSGLSSAIGAGLASLETLPMALIILIAMATMVYLGEIASNTAMAAVFLPVAGAAAIELGVAPLELVLPIGLAASLGFMLPVATPPNAIVYGSGDVTAQQMLKTGAILDVLAIFIIYAIAMILGPWVFVF
jgi:sodium-dependent dicarboxylate transporter 2/3/5